MIGTLAFRHLWVRPVRSLFLLLGFALGVGVMIVLLSVGEAMLDQSRDPHRIQRRRDRTQEDAAWTKLHRVDFPAFEDEGHVRLETPDAAENLSYRRTEPRSAIKRPA